MDIRHTHKQIKNLVPQLFCLGESMEVQENVPVVVGGTTVGEAT